jgi:hypothetical protein
MKLIDFLIFAFSLIVSFIFWFLYPEIHDYRLYIIQWQTLLNGNNLPDYDNAYGIIHYLFSPLILISKQFPKLVYVLLYLIASFLLIKEIKYFLNKKILILIYVILFLNPIFWIFGVLYGSNDLFVSSVLVISLIMYRNQHYLRSVFFLFLGVCYKFTPIILLPYLILNSKKNNFRYLFIFGLIISFLYGIGYLVWEESIFNPFLFGSNRSSKMFSIFAFIGSNIAPLSFLNIYNLDFLSLYLIAISLLLLFCLYIIYKLDRYLVILLSFSFLLLFYKVGHHQFYISLLLLMIYILPYHKINIRRNKFLLISIFTFWIWIFSATLIYHFSDGYSGSFLFFRDIMGLPSFIIHFTMNVLLFKFLFDEKKTASNE